ncbi:mCG140128, partial [Mus musculus]
RVLFLSLNEHPPRMDCFHSEETATHQALQTLQWETPSTCLVWCQLMVPADRASHIRRTGAPSGGFSDVQ